MFRFILGLILGLLCVVFFFQNGEMISVSYFNWTLTLPGYLLLSIFFTCGIFLGWLFTSFRYIKRHKKTKKSDKE